MESELVLEVFMKSIDKDDLAIFIGKNLYSGIISDRTNNIYLDYQDGAIAMCLGMSLFYDKNIYVFFDDYYALRNLGDILSVAVSGNKNIRLVALISGNYRGIESFPTIFSNMTSSSSLFFNMGFLIHDYTRHIKNDSESAHIEIRNILSGIRSPLMVVFKVNVIYKGEEDVDFDNISTESIKKFTIC